MWISGGGEVRECLPCKCEVLSSNPSTAKKKKKKRISLCVVILDTWEAEIRRIKVQDQPRQKVHRIPSQPVSWLHGKYKRES
jgi:hypothetical protein